MQQLKKSLKTQLLVLFCTLFLILGITQNPSSANAEEVSSIGIDTTQTVAQYPVGSAISLTDIYVFVNNNPLAVTADTLPGAQIDQPDNTQVGWKTVTLTYAGITAQYQVKVVPKTPVLYSTRPFDFDSVRAYTAFDSTVGGVNFSYRVDGSTTNVSMGTATTVNAYNFFYDDVILLKPGYTYWFKVRTYQDVNGERFYSDWSSEKTAVLPALTGVQRWRWEAKRQLVAHGVYSKYRLDIIMNIICHESGGNERAGAGRYYVGLMQFGAQWKHDYTQTYFKDHGIWNFQTDNRLSGSWSLHRVAHLIRDGGGTDALKRHWPSTWNL
jgi:hypothetical protein